MADTDSENIRRSIPADAKMAMFEASDGWQLRTLSRAAALTNAKGSVLFQGGRADFIEKYLEVLHDFHAAGWHVTSTDWRGQGGSGRCGPHQYVGHIPDFALWVRDLSEIYADWRQRTPGPHIVVGHSMGGHILLRTLIEGRIDPDGVIFCAPMFSPKGGGMPKWAAHRFAKWMCRIGRDERRAWKVSEKPLEALALRQKLLTHDLDRYHDEQWWLEQKPELVLGPASWRWVERAYASARIIARRRALASMDVPNLVLTTSADQLVDHQIIMRAHAIMPHSTAKIFGAECGHEIYREADEVRNAALRATFDFMDQFAA